MRMMMVCMFPPKSRTEMYIPAKEPYRYIYPKKYILMRVCISIYDPAKEP